MLSAFDTTLTNNLLILKRLLILRIFVLVSLVLYVLGVSYNPLGVWSVTLLCSVSIAFSILVWVRYGYGRALSNRLLIAQLIWDSLIILIFVYLAGGATNPFIYYWLVIIAISASVFQEKVVWSFCVSGIVAYSTLMYSDIDQHIHHLNAEFRSHLVGMWINFVGSAILISFFISRLTSALRVRERALGVAREEILKNEQLIGIGTLAASTVHSFGTPLSTIAMAAGEIESIHYDDETKDYLIIIKKQIDRCKQTMSKLSQLASHKDSSHQKIALDELLADIKEHFLLMNVRPMPSFSVLCATKNIFLPGGILLSHAIINLVDNAIQASRSCVRITIDSTHHLNKKRIYLIIEDDGCGVSPEMLEHFGEAIVSSKKSGLGIGCLLANSTIERIGGSVVFSNPDHSEDCPLTRVTIELPFV